ncbi:antirestriction protein [Alcaligenes phenolicus]|uniref:Antirestriction protein n=1 Tax=Alcaligenes phenolicus TaxID=232846 RepID=A0AAW5VTJ6_9BURK|nr:antirestriction protein [Alcaligenes phenolicus]MCX5565804.1 antirestriction protein [Alcaligenes phenolicus]
MSNINVETEYPLITVQRVEDEKRMDFLPNALGKHYLRGERLVFSWLRELSDDYQGGYWHYYLLSNGAFYMAPDITSKLRLVWANNFFDGEMSADAAGIVATLYGLNHLISITHEDMLIDRYHGLREYVDQHPESSLIWRAID